jgi:NAD(P)-dependent dehydrogenase (short-subunit alcohol dehydrogenase family)
MQLKNKKILVVGAGGLLGSEIVVTALSCGAEVIAADINLSLLRSKLESKLMGYNEDNLSFIELNINNPESMLDFFNMQKSLSGVVNSAYPRNSAYGTDFLDVTLDSFNENVTLNIGAAFLLAQQCAKYFIEHKQSFSLINISSIYGVVAPDFGIYKNTKMTMPIEYAAIKSSLLHLNKYVSSYIQDSKFRVNSVSPGGILDGQPNDFLQAYKRNTRGKGMLDCEDIMGAIMFLLSDQSQYITGQNIIVDDGFTL